ncbi:MAG: hypothetical protein J6R99_03595 [Alphaproteobacteria bacterium]|nr:hypothetical protein [Alphaproteobacteria bacterium]
MANKLKQGYIVHTRGQKIKGWLAFIMLFVCGIMVGVGLNQHKPSKQNVEQWSSYKCGELQNEMTSPSATAEKIKELRKLYAEYCAREQKPAVEEKKEDTSSKETCEVIEEMQLRYLYDETSADPADHRHNIKVYETLFQYGCEPNKPKYRGAISREMQIIESMTGESANKSSCEVIEASVLSQLPYADNNADNRIERAKIYANLSERGCPGNSQKYVELAKQELAIARALQDDDFSEEDTIEVVETYKRLNMQAMAEEFFETAKKLTNPAIDFILEVEKIINEH